MSITKQLYKHYNIMPTNNKPLWQILNEKRTQGIFMLHSGVMVSTSQDKYHRIITIAEFMEIIQRPTEAQANAQYTALAVNNLHVLAEALQELVKTVESVTDFKFETLAKAQEALNRIS